jgi:phage-related protein
MADVSISVEVEPRVRGDKLIRDASKAGDTFADRVEKGLNDAVRRLGIAKFMPIVVPAKPTAAPDIPKPPDIENIIRPVEITKPTDTTTIISSKAETTKVMSSRTKETIKPYYIKPTEIPKPVEVTKLIKPTEIRTPTRAETIGETIKPVIEPRPEGRREPSGAIEKTGAIFERSIFALVDRLGLGRGMAVAPKNVGIAPPAEAGAGAAGAAGGGAVAAGVAGGLAAGGVVAALDMIVGFLKDLPIISAIMKIFKVILTILFLPLVPILKPVLLFLVAVAKTLVPIMSAIMKGLDFVIAPLNEFIVAAGDVFAKAAGQVSLALLDLFKTIMTLPVAMWRSLFNALLGILEFFVTNGTNVLTFIITALTQFAAFCNDTLLSLLTSVWNVILGVLEWVSVNLKPVWDTISTVLTEASDWLNKSWAYIYGILVEVGTWLQKNWNFIITTLKDVGTWLPKAWDNIKTTLGVAAGYVSGALTTVIVDISNVLIQLWNAIANALNTISFGLANLKTMEKVGSTAATTAAAASTVKSSAAATTLFTGKAALTGANLAKAAYKSDFVITPTGTIKSDVNDFIIGTKTPEKLGGKGMNVTINIDKPTISSALDIKDLVKQIEMSLYKTHRRYNSYV